MTMMHSKILANLLSGHSAAGLLALSVGLAACGAGDGGSPNGDVIASGGAPAAAPDLPTVPRSERVLPPLVIAPSTTASPLEKPPGEGAPSSAGPARASGSAGPEDNVGVARESLTADEKKAQDEFFAKLKKLGDTADKLSSYYSDAKTALAVAHSLAEALGLADPVGFSTDTKAILAALDTIAGGINWSQSKAYVDDNMSWTFSAFSAAKRAPWSATAGSGIDLDSNKAVLALAADNGSIAFYRNYNKNINETGRDWPNATSERPEVNNNMVYDYRMGLAPMLESIAIRLQIIAAMDNNFLLDHAFDADLTHYRSVLQWHLQKMKDGIKCGIPVTKSCVFWKIGCSSPLPTTYVCADYYTGLEISRGLPPSGTPSYDEYADLRAQVGKAMPLYQLQSMIDTLSVYISGATDLTKGDGNVYSASNRGLCLETQNGDSAIGTPIWLNYCNYGDAQWWQYDRASGLIRNPLWNTCLDTEQGSSRNGTPVWLWYCTGDAAQTWTWDPIGQVLHNGLGTVLDVANQNLNAQAQVLTEEYHVPFYFPPFFDWRYSQRFAP